MPCERPSERDAQPSRRSTALWVAAALLVLALIGVGAYVVRALHFGQRPPFVTASRGSPPPPAPPSAPSKRGPLRLAGSGSNIPLTRLLVQAYGAAGGDADVVVHRSIGSTGGIRALRDGAVDVALVSRPLESTELGHELLVAPYARVAVVVAAHPSVVDGGLSAAELLAIFRGERTTWSDDRPLVLLLREEGDSSHLALARALPGFARASRQAYEKGLGRVVYSDMDMQSSLMEIEGAVGLFDLGAITAQKLPLKALSLGGVAPSAQSLASGEYAVRKELALVTASPPAARVAALLDFVFSAEGAELTRAAGYQPLARQAP